MQTTLKCLYCVLFLSSPLLAHDKIEDNHNWLHDEEAFKSARVVPPPPALWSHAPFQKYEMNMEYFKDRLKELAGEVEVNFDSESVFIRFNRYEAKTRRYTRHLLTEELESFGFHIEEQNYGQGTNLIAEKPGTSGKVLILSTHYDSVLCRGANDAGTAIAALLSLAKAFQDENFKHTLRIVFFDQEEVGLIGSKRYTHSLSEQEKPNIIGDIQLEMMGYNGRKDGHFHVIDCNRPDSRPLSRKVMGAVQKLQLDLTRVATCTQLSDHSSFWRTNIPAIVISENVFGGDGDPCYHRTCDVYDDRLDFQYTKKIVTAVTSATAVLLND